MGDGLVVKPRGLDSKQEGVGGSAALFEKGASVLLSFVLCAIKMPWC